MLRSSDVVPTVNITFRQLQVYVRESEAQSSSSKSLPTTTNSNNTGKTVKTRKLQLFETTKKKTCTMRDAQNDSPNENSDISKERKRSKKPEMQRYVPKARLAALTSPKQEGTTLKQMTGHVETRFKTAESEIECSETQSNSKVENHCAGADSDKCIKDKATTRKESGSPQASNDHTHNHKIDKQLSDENKSNDTVDGKEITEDSRGALHNQDGSQVLVDAVTQQIEAHQRNRRGGKTQPNSRPFIKERDNNSGRYIKSNSAKQTEQSRGFRDSRTETDNSSKRFSAKKNQKYGEASVGKSARNEQRSHSNKGKPFSGSNRHFNHHRNTLMQGSTTTANVNSEDWEAEVADVSPNKTAETEMSRNSQVPPRYSASRNRTEMKDCIRKDSGNDKLEVLTDKMAATSLNEQSDVNPAVDEKSSHHKVGAKSKHQQQYGSKKQQEQCKQQHEQQAVQYKQHRKQPQGQKQHEHHKSDRDSQRHWQHGRHSLKNEQNDKQEQQQKSERNARHRADSYKSDSRLYDPNTESRTKREHEEKPRSGLIHLPKNIDLDGKSTDTTASIRSSLEVMYPSPPPTLMQGMPYPQMPLMPIAAESFFPRYNSFQDQDYYQRADEEFETDKIGVILREVKDLDRELTSFTGRRMADKSMERVTRLRDVIRKKLETVILMDTEYSSAKSLDLLLWKSVYHSVLENLKSDLQEEDENDEDVSLTQQHIDNVLLESQTFYESLLTKLEKQHRFVLSEFTSIGPKSSMNRSQKLVLIMCQRILICLGDVARYQTQNRGDQDYGQSRRYYLKASRIIPKNGKPYNQLAIIALYAKRKLDTVYYFMRSIATTNPFQSAKESLRGVFNEISKKYEQAGIVKEHAKMERQRRKVRQNERDHFSNRTRIEVWISIDGFSTTDKIDEYEDLLEDPRKMPCKELYSKTLTSFICSQGMLFTKIGMERFPEVSSEFLHQLTALLEHSPITFMDTHKLIQMFSISIFSIHHTGLSGPQSDDTETCRSYTQEQAMQLSLDMFTVVMQRCTCLLKEAKDTPCPLRDKQDLKILLPVLKLFSDWMKAHRQIWNPPPCPRDPTLGPVLDNWAAIADFVNVLSMLDISYVKLHDDHMDNPELTAISPIEDYELVGFLPLMSLCLDVKYVHIDANKEEACQLNRADELITFGDFLCGIEPSMLEYDSKKQKYLSVVQPPSLSEQTTASAVSALGSDEGDSEPVLDEEDSQSEDEGISGVADLRRNHRHLSRQLARQQRQDQALQAVFDKESHMLRITVCPAFLVPDTNCFIEYLSIMRKLITSHKYTVVVPLVVINELDGLSKSAEVDKYSDTEHGTFVRREAASAFEFLDKQFELGNRCLKALTMAGTELTSLAFRSEESTQIGTNDDKILSCCLHYCKDNARDYMPKQRESSINLSRDVVLLTDDRNLRLKAHTRNVPVKDTLSFMKWAKIK